MFVEPRTNVQKKQYIYIWQSQIEVVILGADQRERGLWRQKSFTNSEGQTTSLHSSLVTSITHFLNRFVLFLGLAIQGDSSTQLQFFKDLIH